MSAARPYCSALHSTRYKRWSNELQQDIVILCESPDFCLHIKYYNGNISSWREFYCFNVTCCLNAERGMTDSCSRRKRSFCKLKFNNVNILLSLTWKPNWCSSVSFGVWLPLCRVIKHINHGCLKQPCLDQIIAIRRLFNYHDRPKHYVICSAVYPLQLMSAVRIRVQTTD